MIIYSEILEYKCGYKERKGRQWERQRIERRVDPQCDFEELVLNVVNSFNNCLILLNQN